MKKLSPSLPFPIILIVLLASCSHTIKCTHPATIRYLLISDFDTSATTVLRVVRYNAGTNFASPLDSTDHILPDPFNVSVPADVTKDYEIVVLPQNRRHRLSNVHFGNEKRKGSPGLDSEHCTTSVNFTFDGEQKTMKMAVGGTGGYTHITI